MSLKDEEFNFSGPSSKPTFGENVIIPGNSIRDDYFLPSQQDIKDIAHLMVTIFFSIAVVGLMGGFLWSFLIM